jgi:hypothetical protein
MYINALGERPGTDAEAQASAAASRKAAADWYQRYQSDCKNIRILEHLTREPMGLYEEYILLQKRMKELPKLFEDKAKLDGRARLWPKTRVFTDPVAERYRLEEVARKTNALSPEAYKIELAKLLTRLGYPPNHYLRSLSAELAQARCELSRNIWRSVAP